MSDRAPRHRLPLCLLPLVLAFGTPAASGAPGAVTQKDSATVAYLPVPAPSGLVSLRVTGEPVVDLLRNLSDQGGPRLIAGREIGERRVHVFVQNLPQARLRKALAEIEHGMWLRRDNGQTLLFEASPAAQREREAILAQRKKRLFDGLHLLTRRLALDRAALEELRKTDRTVGYLTRPESRAAVQLTALLGEKHWQELDKSGRLVLSADQMGPNGSSLIREYLTRLNAAQQEWNKLLPPDPPPPTPLDPGQASQMSLQFLLDPDPNTGEPFSHLSVGLAGEASATFIPITGSSASSARNTRWTTGTTTTSVTPDRMSPVTVRIENATGDWGRILNQLANQLRLQIVSEEYTRRQIFPPSPDKDKALSGPLPAVWDQLCSAYGYQWRLKDGVYQFRSATWYADRELEPPGTLIKAVATAREQKQPLPLEWLATAASVAPSRTQRLWVHVPSAQMPVMGFRPLLLFCASLSTEHWTTLETTTGLSVGTLSPQQRALFAAALPQVSRQLPADAAEHAYVRLVRAKASARFTITSGEKSVETVLPLPSPLEAGPHPFGLVPPGVPSGIPPSK
jgi:hypothetical protein